MLALLAIWQKYENYLLVDLPRQEQLPISIKQFESMQKAHRERVQSIFVNDWGDEVEEVFKKYVQEESFNRRK